MVSRPTTTTTKKTAAKPVKAAKVTRKAADPSPKVDYEALIKVAIASLKDQNGSSVKSITQFLVDNKHLKEDGASKKGVDMSIKKGLASNVFAKGARGAVKLAVDDIKDELSEDEEDEKPIKAAEKSSKKVTSPKQVTSPKKTVAKKEKEVKKATAPSRSNSKRASKTLASAKVTESYQTPFVEEESFTTPKKLESPTKAAASPVKAKRASKPKVVFRKVASPKKAAAKSPVKKASQKVVEKKAKKAVAAKKAVTKVAKKEAAKAVKIPAAKKIVATKPVVKKPAAKKASTTSNGKPTKSRKSPSIVRPKIGSPVKKGSAASTTRATRRTSAK